MKNESRFAIRKAINILHFFTTVKDEGDHRVLLKADVSDQYQEMLIKVSFYLIKNFPDKVIEARTIRSVKIENEKYSDIANKEVDLLNKFASALVFLFPGVPKDLIYSNLIRAAVDGPLEDALSSELDCASMQQKDGDIEAQI